MLALVTFKPVTYSGISISKVEFPYTSDVVSSLFNSNLISTFEFVVTVEKLSLSTFKLKSVVVSFNIVFVVQFPSSTSSDTYANFAF